MFFEVVLEVRIETKDKVYKEIITMGSFAYMPRITYSTIYPISIGDDYILQSVSAEMPRETPTGTFAHVAPLRGAELILEGIVSESDEILKQVEIRE